MRIRWVKPHKYNYLQCVHSMCFDDMCFDLHYNIQGCNKSANDS